MTLHTPDPSRELPSPTSNPPHNQEQANNRPFYSDAFQRRERASEDFAIRQREKEKLQELKKKLAEQQAHLKQLSDHM